MYQKGEKGDELDREIKKKTERSRESFVVIGRNL